MVRRHMILHGGYCSDELNRRYGNQTNGAMSAIVLGSGTGCHQRPKVKPSTSTVQPCYRNPNEDSPVISIRRCPLTCIAMLRPLKGKLHFPRQDYDGPVFATRQDAQARAIDALEDHARRLGPIALATIEPYSGPVRA